MKKIVEKAEGLLSQSQKATEIPRPPQHPTLPFFQPYHAKTPSEAPCHKPVPKRSTAQRQLLPAPSSGLSMSVPTHSCSEAPRGQTQSRQALMDGAYPIVDYYTMYNGNL
jgi:hypothetical protein